ncbi:T9SS type A sorting domain-containing protein [Subsaximicrobium wynnwilliamsii]|uniref:T9SS type A sorting domain-containing protein n=1 Tax=Subsaximicrobium wynnwilliamsii TaxID=291179 RepID=A0A5C6ZKY3_9FLAO|nr:endonuclease [Subsaximicrobium wynnwilliamsii]TXD84831.1 T9SS type A sorting domain-containing protein [Subsaximicrobium wynnwilliamsii]TXD90502.1 T9SS type A sorting domain-containing protein [Subsaximicrobium wynnwilliamsii]TXE04977.1 T9SS type A sorting domain-containing protein [Subsaximicrobium wynnwilliamsii]
MKQFYLFTFLVLTLNASAQIPAGYYDSASGTSYELKTQLYNIIDDHNVQSYGAMYTFIATYDRDNYYETNGANTILDVYSENPATSPNNNDPYNFTPTVNQCGNYSDEGDCYNREHVVPQSVFNSEFPMYSDAHELLPTDGRVNGLRSSYPFGVVDDSQLVSQNNTANPTLNGSKLGNNFNGGYSSGYTGIVFEPIDEFKGDIARIHFYFITRYQNLVGNWSSYEMFDGSTDQVLDDPFLSIMLNWHQNDPVSQKEIDRNNNIFYNHQQNRNPFVDHPEFVAEIWTVEPDTEAPTTPTSLMASNPTDNSISLSWTASTDDTAVTAYEIFRNGASAYTTTETTYVANNLTANTNYCFTVRALDAATNASDLSNEACDTTTNNGTTSTDCLAETFANITTGQNGYAERTWTGDDGGIWSATDARTDQILNNEAITIRDGVLSMPATSGGIGALTVTTQRIFSGSNGTFNINVGGTLVATIPYGASVETVTIQNINIPGNVTVTIDGNSATSNRVVFDDLSYTCYADLSLADFDASAVAVYPNPVENTLMIALKNPAETTVEIFDILGKKVLSKAIEQTKALNVSHLNSGIYILRITQNNTSITKKLIKQ